jgi:hypothetical protein
MKTHLAFLAVLAVASLHCVTATPVTPAPVSPEEAPKLQAALIGSCNVTATEKPGSAPKEAKGIRMTFSADGKLAYHIETPFGSLDQVYTYKLDGRNIASDGIYKAMRVDEWNGKTLKLFMYELTQTYHCTKG